MGQQRFHQRRTLFLPLEDLRCQLLAIGGAHRLGEGVLRDEDPRGGIQDRVGGYGRGARGGEGLLPHEAETDSVGGHHRRQRHTGERAGGAGVLGGRHVRVGVPGERVEDERHVRHATFAYFVLGDDGAVAVCVDLAAQQIGHRFPQFRGAAPA